MMPHEKRAALDVNQKLIELALEDLIKACDLNPAAADSYVKGFVKALEKLHADKAKLRAR